MYSEDQIPPQKRGLAAITGAMALIIALLMVQIWLLTATLEAYLAGRDVSTVGAAVFSGIMFAICAGLYLFVRRVDAEVREGKLQSR
jgi:predicted Co/Zn/Cd cation transporter (cation efflux family)